MNSKKSVSRLQRNDLACAVVAGVLQKREGRLDLKRPLNSRIGESDSGVQLILLSRSGRRGGRAVRHSLRVGFDELLLSAVTVGGVEIEVQHLLINLVEIPVIIIEAINRAHHTGAMTATRAVNVELAGFRIVDQLEELRDLLIARIVLGRNRNIKL